MNDNTTTQAPRTDGSPEKPPLVREQMLLALDTLERAERVDEPLPTLLHGDRHKARQRQPSPRPKILEQLPLPLPPASFKPIEVEEQLHSRLLTPPSAPAVQDIAERNLAAALALAAAGVSVFPVRLKWNEKRAKWDKPLAINGWQEASTTDPEQIRAWWRDLPAALGIPAHHLVPGIWCGHPELRLVVIDADRHGGADGVRAFDALVEQNGLPPGPVTKTPTDGRHSVDDIYNGIRRSRAFKGMKAGSIKNAIRRLVAPPSKKAGKLSRLLPLITVTKGLARNHRCKLFAEIRKDPT